ncbi:MAG: tetratricopeptide repeat protein [Pirellulaceae bacterium]|nr:tetratricopeptide repeat protein [Pirellulaceae bacterium]
MKTTICIALRYPLGQAAPVFSVKMIYALLLSTLMPLSLFADDEKGAKDLAKATEQSVTAKTADDLGRVVELCESALEKGLNEEQQVLANQLWQGALLRRAELFSAPIFTKNRSPQWPDLRQLALKDLKNLLEKNSEIAKAQVLLAQLHLLPGGDREIANAAIDKGILLYKDETDKQVEVRLLRLTLRKTDEERELDIQEILKIDPNQLVALRLQVTIDLKKGKNAEVIDGLKKILKAEPDDYLSRLLLAEAYFVTQKTDEALKHVNLFFEEKENKDQLTAYALRARIYVTQTNYSGAIDDLEFLTKKQPTALEFRMLLVRLYLAEDHLEKAEKELQGIEVFIKDFPEVRYLRSLLHSVKEEYDESAEIIEELLEGDPENVEWQTRLAQIYNAQEKPKKALVIYEKLIEKGIDTTQIWGGRGDTYLNLGRHEEALADYEKGVLIAPDNEHVLNNFAWLLATSPEEEVRNGKRAVELATKAAEVTEYKDANILSTLGAAHAEMGNWSEAEKWAAKALELSEEDQREGFQKELDSYKEKKPWREKKEKKKKRIITE